MGDEDKGSAEPKVQTRIGNLYTHPDKQPIADDTRHVSVGDMHGNALKLIYHLIEEGFLTLRDPADYDTLKKIYTTPVHKLTQKDIYLFERIINKSTCNNDRSLTIIGDELADRGMNDYFTLLVLNKLHSSQVMVDIMLSNHSVEFLRDFEKAHFSGNNILGPAQAISLQRMVYLIRTGLIDEKNVRNLVTTAYLPTIKAIGYTVSEDKKSISLFTHAPVGLETIENIAKKYNIEYKEETIGDLINTIDQINAVIKEKSSHSELAKIIDDERKLVPRDIVDSNYDTPLYRLVWNRIADRTLATGFRVLPKGEAYKVQFVHGHIGPKALEGAIAHSNLDCYFGQTTADFKDTTYVIRTSKETMPQPKELSEARHTSAIYKSTIDAMHQPTDKTSPNYDDLIKKVKNYINRREQEAWTRGVFSESKFNMKDKIEAAEALLSNLTNGTPIDIKHEGALNNGRLKAHMQKKMSIDNQKNAEDPISPINNH